MIDAHTHLEVGRFDADREQVIAACRERLEAVVTCVTEPPHWKTGLRMVEQHHGFVFMAAGVHPEFVKEISDNQREGFFQTLREHRKRLVGIGEAGLDYYWAKEQPWREKQREWFIQDIAFAKELRLPLVVHIRDAYAEALQILENQGAQRVQLHLFGAPDLLPKVVEHQWMVSVGAIVLRSREHQALAQRIPLELLMTETDAPFMAPTPGQRNTPLAIQDTLRKIAELRAMPFEELDRITTENARRFFGLER